MTVPSSPADGVSSITLTLCCAAPQLGHISAFSLIIVPHSLQNDLWSGSDCGLIFSMLHLCFLFDFPL